MKDRPVQLKKINEMNQSRKKKQQQDSDGGSKDFIVKKALKEEFDVLLNLKCERERKVYSSS